MKTRLLSEQPRIVLLVLDPGDEFISALTAFAASDGIGGAHFTAIGAFERSTIAYWNRGTKEYERIEVAEQVEVVSLIGSIATGPEGEPRIHAHVSLGRRDGSVLGGHLMEGRVYPTIELFLTVVSAFDRRKDSDTGLMLLRL